MVLVVGIVGTIVLVMFRAEEIVGVFALLIVVVVVVVIRVIMDVVIADVQ